MSSARSMNASAPPMTQQQSALSDLWDEHVRDEFVLRNADATLATMVDDAYVNHVPVMTGGAGKEELRAFYAEHFIPQMPVDAEIVPVSRTVAVDRLVDELILRFTHSIEIDWMLPGVAPTGRRVEVPTVVIVQFRDGKLAHEHIYWDQASVLVQLGLIDASQLPVAGVETARKILDPRLPSNALMKRAHVR
jgi:carboxymethylenebutenolidase